MPNKKVGKQSLVFETKPYIIGRGTVVGQKEGQGPLASDFDIILKDDMFGQKSWEKAESKMLKEAMYKAISRAGISKEDIDVMLAGDLINQLMSSSFAARDMHIPFIGLYGACSTMSESLLIASMIVGGGYSDNVVAITSSHFASSERQYRFPLGYGGQRTPTSQWTVTGAGAALLSATGKGPTIDACTIGTITDLGVKDANNMGAAMAPAAYTTIKHHFDDLKVSVEDYDLIITGDLGQTGQELLLTLARNDGLSLGGKLVDCGTTVFDLQKQDVHSGGSGCGCSAITLCGYFLDKLAHKKLKKILFCGTGALLSPTSTQQGLPIPGVCHAVSITGG